MEHFWPRLFAKALASINIGRLTCSMGAARPLPLLLTSLRRKRRQRRKKEEEEPGDGVGFGLFNYTSFVSMFNKKIEPVKTNDDKKNDLPSSLVLVKENAGWGLVLARGSLVSRREITGQATLQDSDGSGIGGAAL